MMQTQLNRVALDADLRISVESNYFQFTSNAKQIFPVHIQCKANKYIQGIHTNANQCTPMQRAVSHALCIALRRIALYYCKSYILDVFMPAQ
jgi:hypothetical protein